MFIGSLLLCYTSKATGAETFQFWTWLFAFYVGGNIAEKITALPAITNMKLFGNKKNVENREENK